MEAEHLLEGEAREQVARGQGQEQEARRQEQGKKLEARRLEQGQEQEARGRRRHRTWEGSSRKGSRRGSMVAEQLEHRERMMEEVGGEPSVCREVLTRTSSMAGRLAAYCGVQAGTFSRHSSDSGFHSQGSTGQGAGGCDTSRDSGRRSRRGRRRRRGSRRCRRRSKGRGKRRSRGSIRR